MGVHHLMFCFVFFPHRCLVTLTTMLCMFFREPEATVTSFNAVQTQIQQHCHIHACTIGVQEEYSTLVPGICAFLKIFKKKKKKKHLTVGLVLLHSIDKSFGVEKKGNCGLECTNTGTDTKHHVKSPNYLVKLSVCCVSLQVEEKQILMFKL